MIGASVWSGLVHRLFPWRGPASPAGPRRLRRRRARPTKRTPAVSMRLARSNAYTGLSRFTGRSIDRLFLTAMRRPHRYPGPGDLVRVGEEIAAAHALYRGERPAAPSAFHTIPPALVSPSIEPAWHPSMRFEWLSFESGYSAPADDPSSERWNNYERNHISHAWLARHSGPERPWLICIHGLGTGGPYADFAGFRADMLHHELGLNLFFETPQTIAARRRAWRDPAAFEALFGFAPRPGRPLPMLFSYDPTSVFAEVLAADDTEIGRAHV